MTNNQSWNDHDISFFDPPKENNRGKEVYPACNISCFRLEWFHWSPFINYIAGKFSLSQWEQSVQIIRIRKSFLVSDPTRRLIDIIIAMRRLFSNKVDGASVSQVHHLLESRKRFFVIQSALTTSRLCLSRQEKGFAEVRLHSSLNLTSQISKTKCVKNAQFIFRQLLAAKCKRSNDNGIENEVLISV